MSNVHKLLQQDIVEQDNVKMEFNEGFKFFFIHNELTWLSYCFMYM